MIGGDVIAAALVLSMANAVAVVVWAWRREEARARAQRAERLATARRNDRLSELERVRKDLGL